MNRTVRYESHDITFEWDAEKSTSNQSRHGVSFESACEVLFDPFVRVIGADDFDEARDAAIGCTKSQQLLFVVHLIRHEKITRIISARRATASERSLYEEL